MGLDPKANSGMPRSLDGESMLTGLFIIVDDDFESPLYAEPGVHETDEDVFERLCVHITEAIEGDGPNNGSELIEESRLVWRHNARAILTFAAVVDDEIGVPEVDRYLMELAQRYLDEVDDVRNPERDGVEDVVVDVIPSWDE